MYIDEKHICIYSNVHGFAKLKVNENYYIYLDEYLNWTLGRVLQDAMFNRQKDSLPCFYTKLDLNQTIKQIKQNKYFISTIGKRVLINKHYINNYN